MSGLQCVLASLRPAVVALIASAGLSIWSWLFFQGKSIDLTHINWIGVILFLVAFIVLRKWKCNPILVMCCCGIIGLGMNSFTDINLFSYATSFISVSCSVTKKYAQSQVYVRGSL